VRLATRASLPAAILLALAACTGPGVSTGPGADPSTARGLLVGEAAKGTVPLEVDSVPPVYKGGAAELAEVASRAVDWLHVHFDPVPFGSATDRRRLVLRFEHAAGPAADICAGVAPRTSLPPPPVTLHAVFCDGHRSVADATGTARGTDLEATDRLVTAVMDRLFPGRSGGPYLGFPGVSLGVGVGSGGGSHWGVGTGIGVHF
jgi:hypothetical protein